VGLLFWLNLFTVCGPCPAAGRAAKTAACCLPHGLLTQTGEKDIKPIEQKKWAGRSAHAACLALRLHPENTRL